MRRQACLFIGRSSSAGLAGLSCGQCKRTIRRIFVRLTPARLQEAITERERPKLSLAHYHIQGKLAILIRERLKAEIESQSSSLDGANAPQCTVSAITYPGHTQASSLQVQESPDDFNTGSRRYINASTPAFKSILSAISISPSSLPSK